MSTLVVLCLTVIVTAWANRIRPLGIEDTLAFTLLLVVGAVSAGLRFDKVEGTVSFSFTAVVLVAAIPIVGPVGAVIIAIGTALVDVRQGYWFVWLFNAAMFGLSTSVAALVYGVAHGAILQRIDGATVLTLGGAPLSEDVLELVLHVGLPLALANTAFCVTNLVVLLGIAMRDTTMEWRLLAADALRTIPIYLAWAAAAFIVVVLWVPGRVGELAAILVIGPLLVTRWVHARFSEQRLVRTRSIDALARAGRADGDEAHGERVGRYAAALATSIGLPTTLRPAIRYAATLHAVGASSRCTPRTRFGAAGRAEAARAARASHEVIGLIDFLAESAEAVRHQSEWFDGAGGPDGLSGEDIPLLARILAVADTADIAARESTGEGSARRITDELRAQSGTRLDPVLTEALIRTLTPRVLPRARRPHRSARRADSAVHS